MDFEILKEIIVDTLGVDPEMVTPEAQLMNDLNADSLDAVEISMAIEERCGKVLPNEKLAEIVTVADILNILMD